MNILICDDETRYLQDLELPIQAYMAGRGISASINATSDPKAVLTDGVRYDLAFLDIQMPLDGITLARELRGRNEKLALFFVTNYDEYQDDAMDLQAFRFFEKPFDPKRLYAGLDKAMEYIDGASVDLYLYSEGVHKRVLVDDIFYVTRENRRTVMVTRDGAYPTKESFDDWCARLPAGFFYPVHKSFLVNLHDVERYSYSELYLTDGTRIPVAPRRQAAFHKSWFAYLRRR